jgi:hypothetical protein
MTKFHISPPSTEGSPHNQLKEISPPSTEGSPHNQLKEISPPVEKILLHW